ncbi:MAG: beta-hydroxyacyl-ACP dehydratase [Phycisphaeraceae bacterium]|nr:MAG: beta-hydroxyacyl-ACP dehydratase [Phycisphaeraceae bacterium]
MTAVRSQTETEDHAPSRGERSVLFDLAGIDMGAVVASRAEIGEMNRHRHEMALLDRVVWVDDDLTRGVAAWDVRPDEFWVRGHFPDRAMLPGVLMVEAGAQLGCYMYNKHHGASQLAAFLRIEDAVFRRSVEPGQTLLVLCKGVKRSGRRFISDIQGVCGGHVTFQARIHGMKLDGRRGQA